MSSDFFDRISKLSPKRLALLAMELHEKLEAIRPELATSRPEPVAIVGMGCRLPGGVDSPASYWHLLQEGRDAVREVPAERWDIDAWFDPDPDAPARMSARSGGFLDQVDGFDARFFGISPREAQTMDPQQRLALEVTWEALEHAGIAPASLAGTAAGVFLGVCNSDHFQRVLGRGDGAIDAYLASGNAPSVVSGRIAYALGLRGPALSVDTACSSSLVALHLAVQSVRRGEVRVALAGGVNVMAAPQTTVALSKAHMLAPDGRCKTFDAAADGFARGEGCGMLVLKRLADAEADGDRVLAVIRGIACNQDGRSGGLTVPSGPAQEAVIRAALEDARLAPQDITYVEAHGTGTTLGDPIEVRALGAALAAGRPVDRPLLIGSVKTNFGHLESAAGVAGVMKVVLSLVHEQLPRHLHFRRPSPHIEWDRHPVQVVSEPRRWSRAEGSPRRAGVSSFGFSGTNVHVILEEAPPAGPPAAPASPTAGATVAAKPLARAEWVLPLSARSRSALAALATRVAERLERAQPAEFSAIAHAAGAGRNHFDERLAVVARDAATAVTALRAFVRGEPHEALHTGSTPPGQAAEFAFLFTGQGSQYPGMGLGLAASVPAFREVIDRCDAALGADAEGRTLRTVLEEPAPGDLARALVHQTRWTQPALFALELALTETWRRWGVVPAAVIGHSVGEYAAACAAGTFSVEQGIGLMAERGRLMQALPAGGAMLSLNASPEDLREPLRAFEGRVEIAAYNAADNVVVAGDADAIDALAAALATHHIQGQRLHVALAAHSPQVEPALAGLEAAARAVPMQPPSVPVAWNVTGGALGEADGAPDAQYWRRHLREPVRFGEGLQWLVAQGFTRFIEVGPHPTLCAFVERLEDGLQAIGSLRRGRDDFAELMHALARAYVLGATIDWAEVNRPYLAPGTPRAELPTYPFERQSFWIDAVSSRPRVAQDTGVAAGAAPEAAQAPDDPRRPLRATALRTAVPTFERLLKPTAPAWLGEHRVMGAPLVAAPVLLEMVAQAAEIRWGQPPAAVIGFEMHAPLVLPEAGRIVQWQLRADAPEGFTGSRDPSTHAIDPAATLLCFELHSRAAEDGAREWVRHASGRLWLGAPATAALAPVNIAQLAKDLGAPTSCEPHYARLRRLGIDLGDVFAPLQLAHRRAGTVLARLHLADSVLDETATLGHPGLVDGALQAVGMALPAPPAADSSDHTGTTPGTAADDSIYLFAGFESLELAAGKPLPPAPWCVARLRHDGTSPQGEATASPSAWVADVTLHDDSGACLGRLVGVTLRRAAPETLRRLVSAARGADVDPVAALGFALRWEPAPQRAAPSLAAPDEGATRGHFERLAAEHGFGVYDELLPALDDLCRAHVARALQDLGFDARPGRRFEPDVEAQALGIVPVHRRLFARLLQMLQQDGCLGNTAVPGSGAVYEVLHAPVAPSPAELAARHDAHAARFAPVDGELSTLRRCGTQLARVLRGEQDPLQLLFPGGSFSEARQLYIESPYARTYNGTLVEAVRQALATLPPTARLRVLEIGAGTGGTTSFVLPLLPAERTEYVFTDLSPLFLERAAEQFAAWPFMERRLLDIERDPVAQGFEAGRYDLVIAANVLHATADLARAVAHARTLLAPNGQLLLLEGMARERWVDLTFGLTEGWWRFTDRALRPDHPLIDRGAWRSLLQAQGFGAIGVVPEAAVAPAPASRRHARNQQAVLLARAQAPSRRWWLVGGPQPLVRSLHARLSAQGDEVRCVHATAPEVALASPDGSGASSAVTEEIVYLGALELSHLPADSPDSADRSEALAVHSPLRTLATVATMAAEAGDARNTRRRVWMVTQGLATWPDQPAQPAARWMAPLWGLGRVFALEQPRCWGGLVDLPQDDDAQRLATLLGHSFAAGDDEDQTAWNPQGLRHAARLLPAPVEHATASVPLRPDATYLVTGGLGGLGPLVAEWLVASGARSLLLVGRRPDAEAPVARTLRARGARVLVWAGDVADAAFVESLPARLAAEGAPPLAGVMHLAAALSQAPITELTDAQVRTMLAPKLQGTVLLECLARRERLDWLVLFSTSTAVLGAAGLAHYAAANAFLDAVAATAAPGLRILSINWGTWEAMRLASSAAQHEYREAGLLPMPNADALQAMQRLLAGDRRNAIVVAADWPRLKAVHEARRVRPLLAGLGCAPEDVGTTARPASAAGPAAAGSQAAAGPSLVHRLAEAPAAARRDVLVNFVQQEVSAVLSLPDAGAIPLATGLFDLGMDSLMAVELKRRLERGAGKPLPSTLTFNYPNVAALASFLEGQLELPPAAATPIGPATAAVSPTPATALQAAANAAGVGSAGDLSEDELEQQLLARLERLS